MNRSYILLEENACPVASSISQLRVKETRKVDPLPSVNVAHHRNFGDFFGSREAGVVWLHHGVHIRHTGLLAEPTIRWSHSASTQETKTIHRQYAATELATAAVAAAAAAAPAAAAAAAGGDQWHSNKRSATEWYGTN